MSDLDTWWSQFKSDDYSVLDRLVLLDRVDEYVSGLNAEVRALFMRLRSLQPIRFKKGLNTRFVHAYTIVRLQRSSSRP